jgi:hypothetical protein
MPEYNLVTIIEADVALRPISGELHGACPFCGGSEKSTRFWINKTRDKWRCRQCEKNGDAIAYLVETGRMSLMDAYKARRGDDITFDNTPRKATPAPAYVPPPCEPPAQTWQARARAFVATCQAALWSADGARALDWLHKRGLTDATLKAAGIGYNPAATFEAFDEWGLPPETNDKGNAKRVWLPRGIVIPWLIAGNVWRVNIRRPAGEPKYISPAGWKNGLYNADALTADKPALMVEGEFDALLLQQEQGDVVPVATGTNTGSRRERWIEALAVCPTVLVTFDPDKAGRQARKYWLSKLDNGRKWMPLNGDVTDMWRAGIDLEQWGKRGLREATKPAPAPDAPPKKAYSKGGWWRKLTTCDAPPPLVKKRAMVDVWAQIYTAIVEYLDNPEPDGVLLVRAMPGLGKTTTAVKVILRQLKKQKGLIGFFAPRHDLYDEVLKAIDKQISTGNADASAILHAQHYLPRCDADSRTDPTWPVTCPHFNDISEWLRKGYDAIEFCKGVCGFDGMAACEYLRQIKGDIISLVGLIDELPHRPRCIFGMHQHLQGHALMKRMTSVFVDENMLNSVLNVVEIITKHIVSPLVKNTHPLKALLHEIQGISTEKEPVSGVELLTRLGGAERVLEVLNEYDLLTEANATIKINNTEDVKGYPQLYLVEFVQLLKREALEARKGNEYIHRVFVGNGKLKMLTRKALSDKLPQHVVIMDGTADERIIAEVFGRAVQVVDIQQPLQAEVIQVYGRGNGVGSLYEKDAETDTVSLKRSGLQLKQLVKQIIADGDFKAPGLITFAAMENELKQVVETPDILTRHFGAASGTNEFEECDCLIVAGTYQPPHHAMLQNAAMIFYERMLPFLDDWTPGEGYEPPETITEPSAPFLRYPGYIGDDGKGRCYPVGGFWDDADLRAVVWQSRRAELTQAAFRLRPHKSKGKLYLVFNLPLPLVPPDQLMTWREVMNKKIPATVNIKKWEVFINALDNGIARAEVERLTGFSPATVKDYFNKLKAIEKEWRRGKGEIPRGIYYYNDGEKVR